MTRLSLLILTALLGSLLSAQHEHTFNTCHHASGYHEGPRSSGDNSRLVIDNNARSDTFDILHYEIHLDITDYDGQTIRANTIVDFSAKMAGQEQIRLDLKDLTVDSLHLNGMPAVYEHIGESLFVDFEGPAMVGDTLEVSVWYQGHPYQDPQWGGFYFENNYIYNLGIGLSTIPPNFGRVWYPCFDVFVERATYEWHVKSADGFVTRCQGEFLGQEQLGGDTIIRSYRMDTPLPTYLTSIAASNYDSIQFVHDGPTGPVPVELYCKPGDVDEMTVRFANMGPVIDAFEYWWGPDTWDRVGFTMTTVGAMEHPTNISYPQGMMNTSILANEDLWSHEYGHHWWGNDVSPEIHNHMWLKEGGAEYSSHLARLANYGQEAFNDVVKSNHLFVLETAHIDDEGFWQMSPIPDEHIYGRTSYNKGASVWHNLRGYMGDEAYRQGAAAVIDSFYLGTINPETFKNVLSWSTGVPLDDFFDDQVYQPGFSSFVIDSIDTEDVGGEFEHTIHLSQGLYGANTLYRNVPMDLTLIDDNWERHVFKIIGDGESNSVQVTSDFEPLAVFLNAEGRLNQAKMDDELIVTEPTGNINLNYTGLRVKVEEITDSSLIRVEHHWIPPSPVQDNPEILELSGTNFFTLSGVWDEDMLLEGRFAYNGATGDNLDFDLVGEGEESIGLVYRPDASSDWEVYFNYDVQAVSLSDGIGWIKVDTLLQGDYAFANVELISSIAEEEGDPIENFDIYPNPNEGLFFVQTELAGKYKVRVRNINGQEVISHDGLLSRRDRIRVDLTEEKSGVYLLEILTIDGRYIGSTQIIRE